AEETAFTFSPVNDPDGDCGAHLGLLFAREADARAFHAAAPGTGAWIPRDTGRHVYTNWECVMERRGAHVETRNPYAASEVTYTQDMYPATLDVLARTVFIPTTPARGDAEFDALVAALQGAARSAV
ncbi:MAG TPA: hypothetical protein PK794_08840, partial [Armatimonadota bacterium]|nr:hypothetical protein [Armatimonadota bacterium]